LIAHYILGWPRPLDLRAWIFEATPIFQDLRLFYLSECSRNIAQRWAG